MSVDDPGECVSEIGLRINPAEFAGLDERGDDRPVFTATIRTSKQGVLSVQCDRADGALDDVGVDLNASIIEEAREAFPARECIADRLGQLCLLADQQKFFTQPGLERVKKRLGFFLTDCPAFVSITATDARLDLIECGYASSASQAIGAGPNAASS